jgi:hypothetical protein
MKLWNNTKIWFPRFRMITAMPEDWHSQNLKLFPSFSTLKNHSSCITASVMQTPYLLFFITYFWNAASKRFLWVAAKSTMCWASTLNFPHLLLFYSVYFKVQDSRNGGSSSHWIWGKWELRNSIRTVLNAKRIKWWLSIIKIKCPTPIMYAKRGQLRIKNLSHRLEKVSWFRVRNPSIFAWKLDDLSLCKLKVEEFFPSQHFHPSPPPIEGPPPTTSSTKSNPQKYKVVINNNISLLYLLL